MTSATRLIDRLDPGRDRLARMARLYSVGALPALALVLLVLEWPRPDGMHDLAGATFGHDLSQVWVAGRTALGGHAAAVYDVAKHDQAQILAFGRDAALFSWHYPPVFLLPASVLALIPYPGAVLAWGLLSAAAIAFALRAILGSWRDAAIGLAFPTIFDSLSYGQNGLLTASSLTFGLLAIERRPYLGGALIGLVCYKPQLAAFVPLALLASGRWRPALASAGTAAMLALASLMIFGRAPWIAFVHGFAETDADIFREGWAGFTLNASAFGATRLLGASIPIAWAVQIGAALAAIGTIVFAWRRHAIDAPLRNAILLAAIPLVSPYMPVYDLTVLVCAGAFLIVAVREGGGTDALERVAALALFVLALDPRSLATATHLPVGFLFSVSLYALAIRRALGMAASSRSLPAERRAQNLASA